jgi:hypothetical protein
MTILAILGLALAAADPKAEGTAADAVALRDGQVVMGQVVEPSPKGKLTLLVRRAWAESHVPQLAKRWEAAEKGTLSRARKQRLERLQDWRRDREGKAERDDPITPWLDAEIARLKDAPDEPTPLMMVNIPRGEVRSLSRRPKDVARLLRQGWRARFDDVETKPVEELKQSLAGRGFATSDVDPAPVDAMLPIPAESENRWLARRASTEVLHDPGLRFLRYGGFVLPEAKPGEPADLKSALAALKALVGNEPGDPMTPRAKDVAARGRVGLVVTRLDMAEDLSQVKVESTLWIRIGADRWEPAIVRPGSARPDEAKRNDVDPIGADPQVQEVYRTFDGLVGVTPEMKARSLAVGAATRQALGTAQSALRKDLESLAFNLDPRPKPAATPPS